MHVWLRLTLFALALAAVCALAACNRREQAATSQVPKPAQPALRVVALTDVAGYLEPCGCQSKLLGGIDRAAAKLAQLRSERVPLLFVAAGDLMFGGQPESTTDDTDASTQELWKAETLIDILNRMGLSAATPGKRDLSFGGAELDRLIERSEFAWLPAKPADEAAPEAVAGWLGRADDVPIGIVGISTFEGPAAELPRDRLRRLVEQSQREIERLRAAGARLVIGLISADQRTGRRLTQELKGLALAIQGGLDEAQTPAPSHSGDTTLLRAGRQGQGLLIVDVYLDSNGPLVDVSEWTIDERRAGLKARVSDLSKRIQAWEQDESVDRSSLDEQRARLRGLRAELAQLDAKAKVHGNALSAAYFPLGKDQPKNSAITQRMADYAARVNEHNRKAFADVVPKEPAPGAPRYVGSAACQGCHAAAYAWWNKHAHGHAYTTLEQVHKEYNLSCVGCHVTGYDRPGGSTLVNNQGLKHVGCESCHGPGSLHAAKPGALELRLTRSPTESVCKQCHTPDHSDLFEFETYAARLRAKGHGLPAIEAEKPAQ